ncbi:hypothetical protein H8E77_22530 [bacterium]|nr:hypothetical protein [bacterium]
MNRFRFVTVVWGTDFTDAFLQVCLPSQLFPGNLLYFVKHTECIYRIYTTAKDAEVICKSDVFKKLSNIIRVELALITGMSYVGKYKPQTQCHAHLIQSASDDCAFVVLIPDAVWADGAFARLLEISESGKRIIAISTPRLAKETFIPAFLERYGNKDGTIQPVTPPQLVKMAMDHLHPDTLLQFWNPKKNSGIIPGIFYWPVNQEGLLVKQFHLFPLMVRPVDRDAVPDVTIDADYTLKACPDFADVYIVQDSDDICAFDFTSISQAQTPIMLGGQSVEKVADWAKVCTHSLHREFVKHGIRFHWNACSAKWRDVEQQSDAVVENILSLIEDNGNANVPAQLSRLRYFSPRFLAGKVRQKGALGFLKQVFSTVVHPVMRGIYGPSIKIRMVTNAQYDSPNQDKPELNKGT